MLICIDKAKYAQLTVAFVRTFQLEYALEWILTIQLNSIISRDTECLPLFLFILALHAGTPAFWKLGQE